MGSLIKRAVSRSDVAKNFLAKKNTTKNFSKKNFTKMKFHIALACSYLATSAYAAPMTDARAAALKALKERFLNYKPAANKNLENVVSSVSRISKVLVSNNIRFEEIEDDIDQNNQAIKMFGDKNGKLEAAILALSNAVQKESERIDANFE